MKMLLALFQHELALRLRGAAGPAALGLFLLAGILSPLAVGTDSTRLQEIAPGLIWVFACLAALLGLEGMFQEDLSEGRFGVLRHTKLPLWTSLLIMMLCFWLVVCLPLAIATWPISLLFGLEPEATTRLIASLLLGTPALAFVGASLAAICAGLQRGTGLIIFLALPFFAPALIFGTRAAGNSEAANPALFFLAAFSLITLAACPMIASWAIKENLE